MNQPWGYQFSLVQLLSCVWLFVTSWIAACQASLSINNCWSLPKPMSIESVMPSKHLLFCFTYSCPQTFPASGLFKWVSSSHQVAKILEFQFQNQSFEGTPTTDLLYNGLVGSLCSPRDFQEPSPTPQVKIINSRVLCFLYSSTLTSIHDHWKNHSLD